jgi:hypothetical protein
MVLESFSICFPSTTDIISGDLSTLCIFLDTIWPLSHIVQLGFFLYSLSISFIRFLTHFRPLSLDLVQVVFERT